jgi:hypothetical protein
VLQNQLLQARGPGIPAGDLGSSAVDLRRRNRLHSGTQKHSGWSIPFLPEHKTHQGGNHYQYYRAGLDGC